MSKEMASSVTEGCCGRPTPAPADTDACCVVDAKACGDDGCCTDSGEPMKNHCC